MVALINVGELFVLIFMISSSFIMAVKDEFPVKS